MKKKFVKQVPPILALSRILLFTPLILSCANMINVSVLVQLALSSLIITSDVFDGKISRKYNNDQEQIKFRIIDTIADKFGVLGCLMALVLSNKIPLPVMLPILTYNVAAVTMGSINHRLSKEKKEQNISGNKTSRIFILMTAASLFLMNNFTFSSGFINMMSVGLSLSALASISNHIKQKTFYQHNYRSNLDNSKSEQISVASNINQLNVKVKNKETNFHLIPTKPLVRIRKRNHIK